MGKDVKSTNFSIFEDGQASTKAYTKLMNHQKTQIKSTVEPGAMAYTCDPIQEAEEDGFT